ncbi:MAG: SLC13 family permease [Marinilabiliales bacterium]|nr:MAG: SLC13 family permease [Marinilabiliales bacterium]
MPSLDAIIVIIGIIFILISLYTDIMGPALTFLVVIITYGFAGILSPSEILTGFANEQIMVIIMLLLLGDIIRRTAVIEFIFDRLFIGAKSYKGFMGRMMMIVAGFSAFLNNTPLVALMMPYVNNWCKKNNFSPSKFLMPLSFAAILGGCATLIGTSTNLIVNGLVIDWEKGDLPELHLFDFAYVGIPMIVIGFLYILFIGEKLLPKNKPLGQAYSGKEAQYVFEAQLRKGSHLIGLQLEESGLSSMEGVELIEIQRGDNKLHNHNKETILNEGDVLFFAGYSESIGDILDPKSGLTFSEVGAFHKKSHTEIVEVVVSQNSTLINKRVKEINFRARFDATLLAIHRNGEKLTGKISNLKIKAGDALLMLASADITKRTSPQEFYFISKVKDIKKFKFYKLFILLGGTAAAIILSALGFISLFMALAILLILSMALKLANPKDLSRSIDYNLAIIIALSLSLGIAMVKTGVADMISQTVTHLLEPLGGVGLLTGLYIITAILAAYITNKAAVAILFPIAITSATQMGLNPMPFILVVAFAAAANFMTPIGYQTNLMVYGPGRYSFNDFMKVGAPLTFLYMIVTVGILSYMYLL